MVQAIFLLHICADRLGSSRNGGLLERSRTEWQAGLERVNRDNLEDAFIRVAINFNQRNQPAE